MAHTFIKTRHGYYANPGIDYNEIKDDGGEVTLDGTFTFDEIRAIVSMMNRLRREYKEYI